MYSNVNSPRKARRQASSLRTSRRKEVPSFDKLWYGDLYNLPTLLTSLHCCPWFRVMELMPVTTPILNPCSYICLLPYPPRFVNAWNSRIYVKSSAVYMRHRLVMLYLMSANCVVSFKAYGSSRDSMFWELGIIRIHGFLTRTADLHPNSNMPLTVITSHILH
jgi:hypothetical protein